MSRKPFNTRWAQGVETQDSSTVFQEPDNIRLTTGWEGGADKDAPPAGQENWWHNRVDSALQGVERTGVMAYHSQAVYGAGAPTYASDGNYYESIVSANTGNDPVSTSGFWRFIGSSFFAGLDPGDIKMVAHNGIPSQGWLKCNGAILSRASYPRLFAQIGTIWNTGGETSLQFRAPDFRGEFLRGFDDSRGVDLGRQFGSWQKGTVVTHDSDGGPAMSVISIGTPPGSNQQSDGSNIGGDLFSSVSEQYSFTNRFGDVGGSVVKSNNYLTVTRPRNKPVNYWIKY